MTRFVPIAGIGLLLAATGLAGSLSAQTQSRNTGDSPAAALPAAARKAVPRPPGITKPRPARPPARPAPIPLVPRDPRAAPFTRPQPFPPSDIPVTIPATPNVPAGRPGQMGHWPGGPLPNFLFSLAGKRPEEQERILQKNPHFRQMSPREQEFVREKLKRLNAMTPQQRRDFRERFEIFHHLRPEAREQIRTQIFPAWTRLPAPRRQAMLQEFRVLSRMRPAQREQRFVQDTFIKQFSNEEQQLLRQLLSLTAS